MYSVNYVHTYVASYVFIRMYVCHPIIYDTGNVDVNIETKNLHHLTKVYEFDACSLNNASLECVTSDEALNNKAEKCHISTYYHCYARRRCVVSTYATTDKLCT